MYACLLMRVRQLLPLRRIFLNEHYFLKVALIMKDRYNIRVNKRARIQEGIVQHF